MWPARVQSVALQSRIQLSVVYEKAANPFELTAGQTSSTLAINSNGRESHGRGGLLLNPCKLPRQSLVGDRVLADFFLAILFRALSPALG